MHALTINDSSARTQSVRLAFCAHRFEAMEVLIGTWQIRPFFRIVHCVSGAVSAALAFETRRKCVVSNARIWAVKR